MNTEALFLFLILLLGLVLCSFLGGNCGKEGYTNHHNNNHHHRKHHGHHHAHHNHHNRHSYDNYNHYSGSSSPITNGTTYYDKNGDTAMINTNSNGMQSITLNQTGSSMPTLLIQSMPNSKTFTTSDGTVTANIVKGTDGQNTIQFNLANGTSVIFTQQPNTSTSATTTSSQFFGSTGSHIQTSPYTSAYQQSNNPMTMKHKMDGYDSDNEMNHMDPMNTMNPMMNTNNYSSSLPPGIPASQIPHGHEDLYILKSEVVPPVCPVCPTYQNLSKTMNSMKKEKCPPCPACARCPEPSFDCKKVPNYSAINNDYLPEPVLNDFSQFGM